MFIQDLTNIINKISNICVLEQYFLLKFGVVSLFTKFFGKEAIEVISKLTYPQITNLVTLYLQQTSLVLGMKSMNK